jgi:NAD(P)-dependent dehydrogenase (short-subunit alcohol dehydrogenase family)
MGKDLKKQAVVIGATGNLGKAICKELAKNNFIIQEKWMKSNRPNILDDKAFDQLPKKIDAAIYVAGINKVCSFNKLKKEDFENVMNVNLIGAINFYKKAFKSLKKSFKIILLRILKQNVEKRKSMRNLLGKRFKGFKIAYCSSIDLPLNSRSRR